MSGRDENRRKPRNQGKRNQGPRTHSTRNRSSRTNGSRNRREDAPRPVRTEVAQAVLSTADQLLREVVAATETLPERTPPSLGRTLREAASQAQAGVVEACGERSPLRALRILSTTDHGLRRLGVWVDLAERFGDLTLDRALRLLEIQSRLLVGLEALMASWSCHSSRPRSAAAATFATLELAVPDFARS
jgi:hypothetical protein